MKNGIFQRTDVPNDFGKAGGFVPNDALRIDLNNHSLSKSPLSQQELSYIQTQQLTQTLTTLPFHTMFMAAVIVAFGMLTYKSSHTVVIVTWQAIAILPVVINIFAMLYARKSATLSDQRVISMIEVSALLEAIVFVLPVALFLPELATAEKITTIAITLLLACVGTLSVVRLPVAAIVMSTLMVSAASVATYIGFPNLGLMPAIIAGTYGLVLAGIATNTHWEFLLRAKSEIDSNRQQHVISLLLNDLEKGTSDWLWETDKDGKLTYFSPRLANVLDLPESEIRGQRFLDCVPSAHGNEQWIALTKALSREANLSGIVVPVQIGQEKHFWHLTARALRNAEGHFIGFRGIGRDITDKWHADLNVREARDNAEKASAAKTKFLSIIGHEIRTPINSIVGFSELLSSDQAAFLPEASKKEYLRTVLESANHLQGLISDILDATRMEKGGFKLNEQEIDPAEILEFVVKQKTMAAEKANVSIVANLLDDINIVGDMGRLKQVVSNLVGNAIKFSPHGGIINIDFSKGAGGEFVLSIRDAGSGFPQDDTERVFEAFVQAEDGNDRKFGGMGLGLPIARKIARQHGGDVTLRNISGGGADARLVIPPSRVRWPKPIHAKKDVAA